MLDIKTSISSTNKPSLPIAFGLAISIGIFLRLLLAIGTYGTNDILNWENFAIAIAKDGLLSLYASNSGFNHPPLIGLFTVLLLKISILIHVPFYILFKLTVVGAECGIMAILYSVWSNKSGYVRGLQVAGLYSLNLLTILISGYHGNTDAFYGLASIWALVLLIENKFFLSGLVLAAGLNVKLIPLILVAPMVVSIHSWRDIIRWITGLITGLIPILIAISFAGTHFIANVLSYKATPDNWGIIFLIRLLHQWQPENFSLSDTILNWYITYGRWLIIGLIVLLSIWNRFTPRFSLAQLVAMTSAIFLVFASGFGIQYLLILIPLVFAIDPRWGFRLSIITGVSALVVYAHWMSSLNPPLSMHYTIAPIWIGFIYLITWGFILTFLIQTLTSPHKKSEEIRENN